MSAKFFVRHSQRKWRADTQDVPTSPTDLILEDSWLHECHIECDAAAVSPITLSIFDRQQPPVALLVRALAAGDFLSLESAGGRMMTGGITWYASGTGLRGWMIGDID